MSYTTSFHHGAEFCQGHNNRENKFLTQPHIDENGLHENWINEPIEEAYERLFGEALKEYNEKQKRADRKIKSYLQNVRDNSKLNEGYEFIIQVGNEKNHPSADVSKMIFKEYLDSFQERNPGLELFGAYFHADEVGGCPHLHCDYIPVAKGNKTGLKIRNNLNTALKSLGYETEWVDGRMLSAEMKFQEAERKVLTDICKAHGLEIENPHRSKDEYCGSKQLQEARDVRMQNEKRTVELDEREAELKPREEEAEKILKTKTEVEAEKQSFAASKKVAEDYIKDIDEEVKPLPKLEKITNIGSAERLEEHFPTEKTGTFSRENPYEYGARMNKTLYGWFCDKFYNPLKDKCNKLLTAIKSLKQENKLQKDRITVLEAENKALNNSVDKIVDERVKSRSEAIVERAKAEAEAPLKERLQSFENFMNGMKTTFTLDGSKYTCYTGVNSIKKAFDALDDLESLTPYGLQKLAEKMKNHGFESVYDARQYQEKNKLKSITEVPDKPISRGYSGFSR